jgi:hypothetical protein
MGQRRLGGVVDRVLGDDQMRANRGDHHPVGGCALGRGSDETERSERG